MALSNRYSSDDIDRLRAGGAEFNELLLRFQPLIKATAAKFGFYRPDHYHNGLELEDIFQAGAVGLWNAVLKFDPQKAKNARDPFVAYASSRIWQEMSEEIRRAQWTRGGRENSVFINCLEDVDSISSLVDIASLVAEQEWREKCDAAVRSMDINRRQIYQSLIRQDDPQGGTGRLMSRALGLSESRVSQHRLKMQEELRRVVH